MPGLFSPSPSTFYISERSGCKVKGLTLAADADVYAVGAAVPRAPHETGPANHHGEDAQNPAQAGNPAGQCRPRSEGLARLRQSAGLSRLDRALSDRRGSGRPPRPLPIRPPRHAHLGSAGKRACRTRRRGLRRRRPAAVGTGGDFDRAARGRRRRRPYPGHRQRLSADPQFLRGRVQAHGRRDHLLRSADRRRHRQAVQAEHARGVRRGARLAKLRDAGHSGHRQGRA